MTSDGAGADAAGAGAAGADTAGTAATDGSAAVVLEPQPDRSSAPAAARLVARAEILFIERIVWFLSSNPGSDH